MVTIKPEALSSGHCLTTVISSDVDFRYCGGSGSPTDCSIPLQGATGGFAPGVTVDLDLRLNTTAMGVATEGRGTCTWTLRDLDGLQRPDRVSSPEADGTVRFAVRLKPREAHSYELLSRCV